MGFRNEKMLVLPVKAPYEAKYTQISWSIENKGYTGVPAAGDNFVMIPNDDKVSRLSEKDGSLIAYAQLSEKVSQNCSGAVSGNTYIQPAGNVIYSINVNSMKIAASRNIEDNISTDCAVIDNFVYFAAGQTFYCLDINDRLSTVWEYKGSGVFSSPALQGDYIIFADGENIISHHYKDENYSVIKIGEEICGAPFAAQYAVFFACGDSKAYKLRLNPDGSMEEDSLMYCDVGENPSSPVEWQGKLYLTAADGFYILDSLNMETEKKLDNIKGGCDPLICYGNGTHVYTVASYEDRWALYGIFDAEDIEEPDIKILAALENFENGRISVSNKGAMYFRDAVGRVYALTRVDYDYFGIAIKLILLLALIVGVFIWLRFLVKKRNDKQPKF